MDFIPRDSACERTLRSNLAFVGDASLAYSDAIIDAFSKLLDMISDK